MKPMQKITRYPLLLKRLLPNLVTDSHDFGDVSHLIREIESVIGTVNETVRKMEARFRISAIDETLDFGVLGEKFKIDGSDRDLVMETAVKYITKTGTCMEVIVLLFNDLILITKHSKKVDGGYILVKLPIPLEAAVFIDQTHLEVKKGFQIGHQKHEIHSFQSYSLFDKNLWLQEAEATRSRYVTQLMAIESAVMQIQLSRYRSLSNQPKPVSIAEDHSFGNFFFKSKKPASEEGDGEESRGVIIRKNSRRTVTQQPSATDMVAGEKRLSPGRTLLKIFTPESQESPSPSPTQEQYHSGRTRLSPLNNEAKSSSK